MRSSAPTLGIENCGRIVTGHVVKVLPGSVLVKYGDTTVLIPRHELLEGNAKAENPASLFSEGDNLELVLIGKDEKGWKGSVHALPEARLRQALGNRQKGDTLQAQVTRIEDKGAWLQAGQLTLWVPLGEISWSWIDHPSEVLSFNQLHLVQISNILLNDQWLTDKRARRARISASIKTCQAQPVETRVTLHFKAIEFQVRTFARVPRRCDAVALFVLEALYQNHDVADIAELTGLPMASVQQLVTLLTEEGLVSEQEVLASGRRLLAGLEISKSLNASNVGGLFASAAPANQQVHPLSRESDSYPRHLPTPVANPRQLSRFLRMRGETLPDGLLNQAQVGEEQREQLAAMLGNPHVHVFLSQTPNWKTLALDVPTRWLLAGLWKNFEAVGPVPFRPAPKEQGCEAVLMVRYLQGEQSLFWEPATRTLWAARTGKHKVNQADVCEDDFIQHMPAELAQLVAQASAATWCWVQL